MSTSKALDRERERLAASLAGVIPDDAEGGYEVSTAFAAPIVKRFLGAWAVREHSVEGEEWLSRFVRETLRGAALEDGLYRATYEFRPGLCVKRVSVEGRLALEGGSAAWAYRMTMALGWEPGPSGQIRVRPEIGYQLTTLDGQAVVCKDLERSGSEMRIRYAFGPEGLVLEEGTDRKLLGRVT